MRRGCAVRLAQVFTSEGPGSRVQTDLRTVPRFSPSTRRRIDGHAAKPAMVATSPAGTVALESTAQGKVR